ncbi:NAD-dependent epimerase/dehydratase family protein [Paracoccus sp. p4-l81]|uniref:NAD-dependent epimerase/dehydratase family protein n=1 Tax=unclassified Paracoccus (in: a-proteobacteria) TaxID=2688777 RepID=UPI0035BA5F19
MTPEARPRWLFTGGSGRVGRMVLRAWQQRPPPADLLIQTRHRPGLVWSPLTEPLPDTGPLDCVIAFAGITPATGSDLSLNTDLAQATLAAAQAAGARRVLLTSSSAVYGAPPDASPLSEASPLRPVNAYGAAKVDMEAACQPWRDRGLEVCCLRIGNVAGADALLLNGPKASAETPIRIDRFADGGGPIRSYLGPATLAAVVQSLACTSAPLPDQINIAAPGPIGMDQLADAAGLPWVWSPAPTGAHQRITLTTDLIAGLHSFAPTDSNPAEMVRQWTATRDPA